MSKVTFYGSPAWVGAIHGATICDWWSSDPAQLNWDRSLLQTVDLAKTPSAAIAGHIKVSQIEVDDHTRSGGRTTIGPMWPGGTSIGACWVSDLYLARTGMKAPPAASAGATLQDYERTTVHYFDGEQGNRVFHGFHANVLQVHGPLSLVEIWNPGTGAGPGKPAGSWWLDLAADADPGAPLSPGQPGPLYLDATKQSQLALFSPKFPPFVGTFAFPPPSPLQLWPSPGPKQP